MKTALTCVLAGACLVPSLRAEHVVVSEVMYHPLDGKPEYIELYNVTTNRRDIAKWRLKGGADLVLPDFDPANPNGHMLKEHERMVLSSADPATTRAAYPEIATNLRVYGPWSGQLKNSGDQIVIEDAAGTKVCELNYGDSGKWPVAADGTGHSLVLVNENRAVDDWHNWKASARNGGSPGNPERKGAEEPIPNPELSLLSSYTVTNFNSAPDVGGEAVPANPGDTKWRFYNAVTAPPVNWKDPGFDDSSWGPGDPALGYAPLGTDPLATAVTWSGIRTPVPLDPALATCYFRTKFNWTGPLTGNSFATDQFIDDGAILWLNGREIGRTRITTNPALHTSTATSTSADATLELNAIRGTAAVLNPALVAGENTLAVEVHNASVGGDDLTMALRLMITGSEPGVVINEVHPSRIPGQGFVEFYNPLATPQNLTGFYLSDTDSDLTKFQITGALTVAPGAYATIDFASSGLTVGSPVTVYLTRPDGVGKVAAVALAMPTDGRSAGRKPSGSSNWFAFLTPTPGAPNASTAPPDTTLRLSEAHFDASGSVDWVEFANTDSAAASGAGLFVASTKDVTGKVALPASVSGNGYATSVVNFPADAAGAVTLYLLDAAGNILDTASLTHRAGLPSLQRYPLDSADWYHAATATLNAPNSPALHTEVVINEIMAAPPSSRSAGEFVELRNRSASAVSLTGWRFTDGISFDFPPGASIPANGYVVVAKDPQYIAASYPGITGVYGPFDGTLRNNGEQLRLEDERANLADIVDYRSGGQWPSAASGEGSSLELLHPDMDNSQPSSWRASDESTKTAFETYTYTDTYRELRGLPSAATNVRELLITAVSDAHFVIKGLSLTRSGSANLITTGDATSHNGSSATGLLCTGTHSQSDTLADGFHLISTGSGDTKNNKTEVDCTGIAKNDVLTLTFQARWVSGLPILIMQTWDRSFGRVFRLPIPANLGTPGATNSTALPAAAPNADFMRHSPAVPRSTDSVVITARVSSPVPLASVSAITRTDNTLANGAWTTYAMNDAGTAGDATAGDGIYSATVPPTSDGNIIQFYIRATSTNGQSTECPRDGTSKPGMWIVDNSPPNSAPGILTQRFIVSKYHRDALGPAGFTAKFDFDFPRMSNFEFNTTIITGETDPGGEPEIFYSCGMRKGGSPWTRSTANTLDRMRWKPPGDDVYRGRGKTGVDNDSAGASRFHNRISRYMLYLFGYQVPDSEFIQQIVNADAPRIGDDVEPTDSDFFSRAYPNGSDGELFEIDDAWYMYDGAAEDRISADSVTGRWQVLDWSNVPAYPSADSPVFYHGNWPVRFPEDRYDYSALASFFKCAATGTPTTDVWREQMESQIDTSRAAIYAAVRGYNGDWDNFTMNRGKNGYFYRRPTDGKFEFHHWDSDLAFQNTGEVFLGTAGGVGWTNFSQRPWFRRQLTFYLTELVNRYTKGSVRMQAWLDAMNYQSTNTSSLAPFKTTGFNYPGWFTSRESGARAFINASGGPNFTRAFSVSTLDNQTVATPVFALTGDGPSSLWSVQVDGHPEAVFTNVPSTSNLGLWTVTNLQLSTGVNTLTIRGLASDGTEIASQTRTVTLSVNAPPVAVLTSDPASLNVATNEQITFDGTASVDPEGGPLGWSWSIAPSAGTRISHPVPGMTVARFDVPGVYTITMTITDTAGGTATVSREVAATAPADFLPFAGALPLPAGYTAENVAPRTNFSPSSWYSVEDVSGKLLLQVLDDSAKPLDNPAFTYPLITRDLPDSADFVLQTNFSSDTRQIGAWFSGLWLETTDGGQPVRYAFGLAGGTNLMLFTATGSAPWQMIGPTRPITAVTSLSARARLAVAGGTDYTPGQSIYISGTGAAGYDGLARVWTRAATTIDTDLLYKSTATGLVSDAVPNPQTSRESLLRIRRTSAGLSFESRNGDTWGVAFTAIPGAGTVATRGGLFLSTTQPISARVAFDYLLLADPSNVSPVVANLRLTEIMYNPPPGGVEFLEFQNTGSEAIPLGGVTLGEGSPVGAFTFPATSLAPGEYIILTENQSAFQALYGTGPRIGGVWSTGNLSNGGERILLQDADGNAIHDFSYNDSAPWPLAADGLGSSLEVINPDGDYSNGLNWRASALTNGSPGASGVIPDADGDGIPDSMEALFGTDPNDPSSRAFVSPSLGAGQFQMTWPAVSGRSYRVEGSATLTNWTTMQTVTASASTAAWADPAFASRGLYFYRVVAIP